jgi:hypothetical protein
VRTLYSILTADSTAAALNPLPEPRTRRLLPAQRGSIYVEMLVYTPFLVLIWVLLLDTFAAQRLSARVANGVRATALNHAAQNCTPDPTGEITDRGEMAPSDYPGGITIDFVMESVANGREISQHMMAQAFAFEDSDEVTRLILPRPARSEASFASMCKPPSRELTLNTVLSATCQQYKDYDGRVCPPPD